MTPNAVKIVLARYMMRVKKSGKLSMWHADFLGGRGSHDYSMNYGSLEIRELDSDQLTGTVYVIRSPRCVSSAVKNRILSVMETCELWDGQKATWRAVNIEPPDILEWIHENDYFSYSWIGVA